MSPKVIYTLGATIGGSLGGYLPALWGASLFSGWGIIGSTVGGLAGVWLGYKYVTS